MFHSVAYQQQHKQQTLCKHGHVSFFFWLAAGRGSLFIGWLGRGLKCTRKATWVHFTHACTFEALYSSLIVSSSDVNPFYCLQGVVIQHWARRVEFSTLGGTTIVVEALHLQEGTGFGVFTRHWASKTIAILCFVLEMRRNLGNLSISLLV